jgi:hypothetical protein
MTNSIIRQIVESIAATLSAHAYFRTLPVIPVIVEDHRDIDQQIEKAMNSCGAFVLVNFSNANTDTADTPGPYMDQCEFVCTVAEIPSVWRQQVGNQSKPSCTEIAEAVSRILHHHTPLDKDGDPLTGGVLIFEGMAQDAIPPMLQQIIRFNCPVGLQNTTPTR